VQTDEDTPVDIDVLANDLPANEINPATVALLDEPGRAGCGTDRAGRVRQDGCSALYSAARQGGGLAAPPHRGRRVSPRDAGLLAGHSSLLFFFFFCCCLSLPPFFLFSLLFLVLSRFMYGCMLLCMYVFMYVCMYNACPPDHIPRRPHPTTTASSTRVATSPTTSPSCSRGTRTS